MIQSILKENRLPTEARGKCLKETVSLLDCKDTEAYNYADQYIQFDVWDAMEAGKTAFDSLDVAKEQAYRMMASLLEKTFKDRLTFAGKLFQSKGIQKVLPQKAVSQSERLSGIVIKTPFSKYTYLELNYLSFFAYTDGSSTFMVYDLYSGDIIHEQAFNYDRGNNIVPINLEANVGGEDSLYLYVAVDCSNLCLFESNCGCWGCGCDCNSCDPCTKTSDGSSCSKFTMTAANVEGIHNEVHSEMLMPVQSSNVCVNTVLRCDIDAFICENYEELALAYLYVVVAIGYSMQSKSLVNSGAIQIHVEEAKENHAVFMNMAQSELDRRFSVFNADGESVCWVCDINKKTAAISHHQYV